MGSIPDSKDWIPDSKSQDSGFQRQKNVGFRIPDSRFPYTGRNQSEYIICCYDYVLKSGLLYFAKRNEAKRNENLYFAKWKICTLRNGSTNLQIFHFAKYSFSISQSTVFPFRKVQIFHFAKYIFSFRFAKYNKPLRAAVSNFRESAVRKCKFEFSFFTPKRPFYR